MTRILGSGNSRLFQAAIARATMLLVSVGAATFLLPASVVGSPPDPTLAIRRLEDELTAAFNKYDAAALNGLWDEGLTFVFPNGTVAGKAERLAGLKDVPAEIPQSTNESIDVKTFGNVAVAIVVSKWPGTRDGKPFFMRFRATHVWARRDGAWKLVSAHVSQIRE